MALIEGINLASLGTSGPADPYVAFTCNGKTRTSSVQFQTSDPKWNGEDLICFGLLVAVFLPIYSNSWKHIKLDVLEFDAMEEPPSVLDVEVYDFDGPFELAASLGYVEINFLKHSPTELADMWIPLEGKLARSSQSKLHLRIFLDNNKGGDTVREYLTKMEKEVGTKVLTLKCLVHL